MLRLRVVAPPPATPFEREITGDEALLGRSEECHVVIPDRAVSRRHARLFQRDGKWFVEDAGSRGGTRLNGSPVDHPTAVGPGDEIAIGQSSLIVQGKQPSSTSRRSSGGGSSIAPGQSVYKSADALLRESVSGAVVTTDVELLRRRAARLELLNAVHQALSRSIALDELLEMILDKAFEALQPEEGVIVLRDGPGEYRRAVQRRAPGSVGDAILSKTILEEVVEKKQAALVCDVAADTKFGTAASIRMSGVRSLIAAPLYDEEGPLGMIALDSRAFVRPFTEDDLELLTSMGAVASLRIRNVALLQESIERRRLEEELQLARSIQLGLLPRKLPTPDGWALFGTSFPSRFVSGDHYQVVEREGGEILMMTSDVSGKGMAAALLTASLEALSAVPIEAGLPVEELCRRVSKLLFQRTPAAKYATSFVATVELASGHLRYTNAGHNPALLVRESGAIEQLSSTGVPLGMLPEAPFTARELDLAPGDLLVVYTDGIVEAFDASDEEFGLERLEAVCREHRAVPLSDLSNTIDRALEQFVRGVPYPDDRTLVLLRREPT
ncbi:MAG: SpoIIE family protein phosphatase [Thermoanaerobaculia bacterium]|nr:SpoIIE family protein phosphatase [Thermoanaerobaculia bacterium]